MAFRLRDVARLCALVLLLSAPGWRAAEAAGPRAFPSITVASTWPSGSAAIAALGSSLPAVAAYYGLTPEQLRQMLLQDSGYVLSRSGRLLHVSRMPAGAMLQPLATAPRAAAAAAAPPYALDQSFRLHSKTDARKTVYLNFAGRTLSTADHDGLPLALGTFEVDVPPFSADADPAFSAAELSTIQEIWQRVAEDYASFDVDVTTEPPDPSRITRVNAADQDYGTEVLFTLNTDEWFAAGDAGASLIGSFFDVATAGNGGDRNKPALVFYTRPPALAQFLADAASRELGKAMGLFPSIKGCGRTPYAGSGDNPVNGWAPIMGDLWLGPPARPLRQFDKGEYAGAGCSGDAQGPKDSFKVITDFGLPLRADDAGNASADASWLPVVRSGSRSAGSFGGVIASSADTDAFYFKAGAGPLEITADPAPAGPNADLVLTLRDGDGKVVQENAPVQNLGARISTTITSPGRYVLEVKGGGEGDPLVSGYSNYGSVGAYTLNASFAAPGDNTLPLPRFSATPVSGRGPLAVTFDASTSTAATGSQIMRYSWDFGHGQAFESATPTAAHVYPASSTSNGRYRVTLTVTDDTGLTNSSYVDITVTADNPGTPTAAFTMTQTPVTGFAPSRVAFDASTSQRGGSDITSYAWVIHDKSGNASRTGVAPEYVFQKSGTFDVDLTVTNSVGTSTTTNRVVVNNTAPTASFTATRAAGQVAAPMDYTFDASASQDDDGGITSYDWTISATSGGIPIYVPPKTDAKPFTLRFEKPGIYTVRLQTSDGQLSSPLYEQTFIVNQRPVAKISESPGPGQSISLDAGGSTDDRPTRELTYLWTFADGTTDTTKTVSRAISGETLVDATLTVRDADGATDQTSMYVSYSPSAFSITQSPSYGTAPSTATFTSLPLPGSVITGHVWEIGSPVFATLTGSTASYSFADSGTFPVRHTVTTANGSSTTTRQVVVNGNGPTASFTVTPVAGQVAAPMDYTLNASASGAGDGGITAYDWTVIVPTGASPIRIPSAPVITQRFEQPGTYTIRLQTRKGQLTSPVFQRTFTVNQRPVAKISATPGTGLSFSFDARDSTDDQPTSELTYSWDFGDGTTATTMTATHTFASATPYVVTLTVRDAAGATSMTVKNLDLTPVDPKPTARIGLSAASGTAPLAVTFDGTASSGSRGIVSYAWNFNDGSSDALSSLSRPVHVFRTPGDFPVTLTVRDAAGVTAVASTQVRVTAAAPRPTVAIISVSLTPDRRGRYAAQANVAVRDAAGKPANRAGVTARWSGPYTLSKWATTRSNGVASFRTPPVSGTGCFTLAVTALKIGATTYPLSPPVTGQACR